jgi:hypothetical protein
MRIQCTSGGGGAATVRVTATVKEERVSVVCDLECVGAPRGGGGRARLTARPPRRSVGACVSGGVGAWTYTDMERLRGAVRAALSVPVRGGGGGGARLVDVRVG